MNFKLNGSLTSKVRKSLYCSTCNSQFLIKDLTLRGSRCPLLMQCGHSTCENCLQQSLKTTKSIKCQQCGFTVSLKSSDLTGERFPLNMYLLGSLIAWQNLKLEKEKQFTFLMTNDGNFDYEIKEQLNQFGGSTCEECSSTAAWYCENCRSFFCEICWSNVHGLAKSLMKHCRSPIETVQIKDVGLKKCPKHDTHDLEFYCKSCCKTVCSHCVILQHQGEGHSPITLKEKNEEIISVVKTAADKAKNIVKTMRITLEKLNVTQNSSEIPDSKLISNLECQITRNFFRFHGLLQLEEDKLLQKLHRSLHQREDNMKALRLQLEKQIKNVEHILRQYEYVVKKPDSSDLTDLHQQLEEVQNLPYFLIKKKSCDKNPKVEFDEKVMESLQWYCTLDLPSPETFELSSCSDLPKSYAAETLDISDNEQKLLLSSASDNETLSDCSSQDLLPKRRDESNVFLERKNYSVLVSYIKNPGEFYVTLKSQRKKQKAINKKASLLADSSAAVSDTVAKDEIYLVKYKVDNKWYRGRVIEVCPSQTLKGEICVTVYYIDYGNSETVSISRLRPISSDMLELPPLAFKCKLYGCVPKNGKWCKNSTVAMEKILKNYTATMLVYKVHRDCLEVDLSVSYPEGEIGREIISVCDALFFLEFSSFVNGPKFSKTVTASRYLDQKLPSKWETFDVIITHVNSPKDFYVQKAWEDPSYLLKLNIDLQKYYSHNLEKGIISYPFKGTACAALFPVDQKWYRAKIVGIRRRTKMVRVFYVDYGNKEVLPWTSIRKLKECFIQKPPLAINCELSGFSAPANCWKNRTFYYLKKCEMVKSCRILVDECLEKKQKLKVLLYEHSKEKEVCLNTLFADQNFNIEPIILQKSQEELEEEEKQTYENISSEFTTQEKPVSDDEDQTNSTTSDADDSLKISRFYKKRSRNRLNAKKLRELHESEKKNQEEASSTEDVENEVEEYDNNVFKVQVEILNAESPSCIYVTFPALTEEYNNLQVKLNEFYKDFTPSEKEWTVNSSCAVFDSTKNCWFRGSVLSILSEDQVEVFLKDIAQICIVPVSDLRELDPSFMQTVTCSVKCHLADIKAPEEKWPGISSEFLLNELENYKEIYMTKKGQIENQSLPVELWVKKMVTRGALEPSTKEWITLNRLLVDQGLAVISKQEVLCRKVLSKAKECFDDDKKSDCECVESATEVEPNDEDTKKEEENFSDAEPSINFCWLSPEPLKKSHFVGIPTYVDCNAGIFTYDIEDDEKLKMIRDALQPDDNSEPELEDHFWIPGQLCIVKYHMDGLWYRGQIIQVNEDLTYEVLFVDYGNVETCQVAELRKKIKMLDIPILSHKLQLRDIAPISEGCGWPLSVVEILHSIVVGKKCEVKICKPALDPNEPNIVSLILIDNNLDVGKFLVDQGLVLYTCIMSASSDIQNEKALLCKKDFPEALSSGSKTEKFYTSLNIPDDCNGFFIEVITVISETEFFARLIDDKSLPSSLKNVLKEFESFQKKLNQECHSQPFVEKFVKGHPCCCIHPVNYNWCRGKIARFLKYKNLVSVFYVDHGTTAFVSKSSIREYKTEWLSFPKMALKCKLEDIKKSPKASKAVCEEALTVFLNRTAPLFVEILSRHEEVLTVRPIPEKTWNPYVSETDVQQSDEISTGIKSY